MIYRDSLEGISPLNIGQLVAKEIQPLLDDKRFSMKAMIAIDNILSESIGGYNKYGKLIAIENLGILFDPDLKLNFHQLLDKHSSSNALFIKWDGEIENDNLYFLSKKRGIKIDLKNISHIII